MVVTGDRQKVSLTVVTLTINFKLNKLKQLPSESDQFSVR